MLCQLFTKTENEMQSDQESKESEEYKFVTNA